jgi:hypothetical protein
VVAVVDGLERGLVATTDQVDQAVVSERSEYPRRSGYESPARGRQGLSLHTGIMVISRWFSNGIIV